MAVAALPARVVPLTVCVTGEAHLSGPAVDLVNGGVVTIDTPAVILRLVEVERALSMTGDAAALRFMVVDMAASVGVEPRLAALVVGLAASNSFILPTHQVNALYMGPGGYTSVDFLKSGLPLSILYLLTLTGTVFLFY